MELTPAMNAITHTVRALLSLLWKRRLVLTGLMLSLFLFLIWLSHLLPRRALAELGHLTHTQINATSAKMNLLGQVCIQDLAVAPRQVCAYDNTLLRAQEVRVGFSWTSLWRQRPRIKQIQVYHFTCDILYDPNTGIWNTKGLTWIQSGKGGGSLPRVELKDGMLRYLRITHRRPKIVATLPFDTHLEADPEKAGRVAFQMLTGPLAEGFGGSRLQGHWHPGQLTLRGGLSVLDPPNRERTWAIPLIAADLLYDSEGAYSLRFRANQARAKHTPEADALDLLQPFLADTSGTCARLRGFIKRYQPAGRINLDLDLYGRLQDLAKSRMEATLTCLDVSIKDSSFPYLIEHLKGIVRFSKDGLESKGLTGYHGNTEVHLDFKTQGSGAAWQYDVHMTSPRLPLDQDLYRAIPLRYQRLWDRLQPSGTIWLDNRITRHSATHKTRLLHIRPLSIKAVYSGFPYPLEQVTGDIHFGSQGASLKDVQASQGSGTIVLNGKINTNASPPDFDLMIDAQAIPFDETLAQALPKDQQETYRRLRLHGQTNAHIHVFNASEPNTSMAYQADLDAQHVSLDLPIWRTDLKDSTLNISLTPQTLTIHSLAGRSGTSPVFIQGLIHLTQAQQAPSYQLAVHSDGFEIVDLLAGLPEPAFAVLDSLQAKGQVGFEGILQKLPDQEDPNYTLSVHPQGIRVQPHRWPYPWRDLKGSLRVTPEFITVESLSCVPDVNNRLPESDLTLYGHLDLLKGRCETAQLTIAAQGIPLDPNLILTLPATLHPALESLKPTGYLTLAPSEVILSELSTHSRLMLDSNISLEKGQATLFGLPMELDASAHIQCSHQREIGLKEGMITLQADRLRIKGKSATDVKATWQYDPSQTQWNAEKITADFYGGHLLGSLCVQWNPKTLPGLQTRLACHGANLQTFLLDSRPASNPISPTSQGVLAGSLSLGLQPEEEIACIGHCHLTISDMQVGARSPLAQVLSRVSTVDTDDIHFERMFANAYIQNHHVVFPCVDIAGPSLALQGNGFLDLKANNIHLDLITRGRRLPSSDPTVLQSLSEGLGGAVMRLEVTGDPMKPQVNTRTLPLIEDSLRIIGSRD